MTTLWKKNTDLHPTFAHFNQSLQEDWFLLRHELALQGAHVAALQQAGIVTAEEADRLRHAIDVIFNEYADAPCPSSEAEDLHTWVEAAVVDQVGSVGRKLHTARSRNDQVATLIKLYVVEYADRLYERLHHLVTVCCERAEGWAEMPMPMLTHAQFAAPGSAGFWILRYASAFDRARRWLQEARRRWRAECPLGSAAVAGSSIPIDRRIQAKQLGFDGPSRNALDSTSTRDECLEWLALLSQVAVHFQGFAADVIAFAQTPFGWIDYPGGFGTGSSMMPNKANPDAMELLRGEACGLQAAYMEIVLQMKGLPSGYNRDLQCGKPVLRGACEKAVALAELVTGFVEAVEFRPEVMRKSLVNGHMGATLRMEQLVMEGRALRDAHHEVADHLDDTRCRPEDIARYVTLGGAGPEETRRTSRAIREGLGPLHGAGNPLHGAGGEP